MNCLATELPKTAHNHLNAPAEFVLHKVCARCGTTKQTQDFRADEDRKDGCAPWCRDCERSYGRAYVRARKLPSIPSTTDEHISPEYTPDQLDRDRCRELFDYEPRNGDLLWRSTGKRVLPRLVTMVVKDRVHFPSIEIDGRRYRLHVLIWNWHKGKTDLAVIWKDGNRLHNRIQNLREVAAVRVYEGGRRHNRQIAVANLREPITCPCCFQEVWRPTLDAVADMAGLQPMEKKVLSAIWAGAGMPVDNERIFLAMYQDDADGGPEPAQMYSALKVALSYMRGKLRGTGVGVENCGYRNGYRLVLGE